MKRLIFLLAFVPAFLCNGGCGSRAGLQKVSTIANNSFQEVEDVPVVVPQTTKYVLKLNPSLLKPDIQVERVEVEVSYKDKETEDLLYMKQVENDSKLFTVEVPRRAIVKFSVWLNPNSDPEGGSYCDPVRLYSDGLFGEQTGQLHEEEVLLIIIMSDMWLPRYCIYKRLSYEDL